MQQYTFGSRVSSGGRYLEDVRPLRIRVEPRALFAEDAPTPTSWNGIRVIAPNKKTIRLTDALVKRLGLHPSASKAVELIDIVAIRAVVALHRSSLWDAPENALKKLRLPKDAAVVVTSDRFHHVTGAQGIERKRAPKGVLPSASETYRSLAQALVMRDARCFKPGKPNTDYHSVIRRSGEWVLKER